MQNIAARAAAFESYAVSASQLSDPNFSAKPSVLRALTDLLSLRAEPDEEQLARYRELALRMIPQADAGTLIYVASRLARHAHAPPSVLAALARTDKSCARAIAEHAVNLPLSDQMGFARGADPEAALALARRRDIGGDITEALVMRREPAVLEALAANQHATFSRSAIERIAMFTRQDAPLLAKFSARAEEALVAPDDFIRASGLERARLLLAARRAHLGKPPGFLTRDDALAKDLHEAAQERRWDAFNQRIAGAIGWEKGQVETLTRDAGGEPLALLLCALGCSKQYAVRVFLCCEPPIAHSYARVRALSDAVHDTPPAAAVDLLEAATGHKIQRQIDEADVTEKAEKAEPVVTIAHEDESAPQAPAHPALPKAYTLDVRAALWGARERPVESARGMRAATQTQTQANAKAPAPARERPKAAVLLRRG